MTDAGTKLLEIDDLRVSFDGASEVVRGIDLTVETGQVRALVGESGSGKSASALSVLGLLPEHAHVTGRVSFGGQNLLQLPEAKLRRVRGRDLGMVFQEPMSALNPALRIGRQLAGSMHDAAGLGRARVRQRSRELLDAVHIRDPEQKLRQFPHELSGGQRQRVMIAMAIANGPQLLVADEPTTALDVTVQAEVLRIFRELRDRSGMGILLITHDLGVVADIADRVSVMNAGEIVEEGTVFDIFARPQHPYTRQLLENSSVGDIRALARATEQQPSLRARLGATPGDPPAQSSAGQPLLEVRGLSARYPTMKRSADPIVRNVSVALRRGETLAIVGESGSGKSTLGRALVGLLPAGFDHAEVHGARVHSWRGLSGALTASLVFQDSGSALNPRLTIGESILAPRRFAGERGETVSPDAAAELLDTVGIDAGWGTLYPHQLSGGQRQRVGIARAISRVPELLIADEPTSALDVSVQKRILILLARLQAELRFGCVFITHDLHLARSFADRVAVMRDGDIVEQGTIAQVLTSPAHEYTRQLLSSTLGADPSSRAQRPGR